MTKKEALDLTISIVSYNTSDFLRRCLESIYRNTDAIEFEVIVVDNASRDGSPEMVRRRFPQVNLIANQDNRFFTSAHNQALTMARGRYFLILNSDTEIPEATLAQLATFLDDNPAVGATGCREVDPRGATQRTGSTFSSPWIEILERTALSTVYRLRQPLWRYRMVEWDRLSSRDVDVLTDCFLMVRRDLLEQLEGYDERFLLYYTENDLCLRIWGAGDRVHFRADCHYIHHGHRSTVQLGKIGDNRIYEQDMVTYYRKHFGYVQTMLMLVAFKAVEHLGAPLLRTYRRMVYGA